MPRAQQSNKPKQIENEGQHVNGLFSRNLKRLWVGHDFDEPQDKNGAVIEVEEETALESIPAAAKEAIQKRAAGGQIKKVETVTHGPTVSYEAAITKNGKKSEVAVNVDGSSRK